MRLRQHRMGMLSEMRRIAGRDAEVIQGQYIAIFDTLESAFANFAPC